MWGLKEGLVASGCVCFLLRGLVGFMPVALLVHAARGRPMVLSPRAIGVCRRESGSVLKLLS
jgi:hypothetical protein